MVNGPMNSLTSREINGALIRSFIGSNKDILNANAIIMQKVS